MIQSVFKPISDFIFDMYMNAFMGLFSWCWSVTQHQVMGTFILMGIVICSIQGFLSRILSSRTKKYNHRGKRGRNKRHQW